MSSPDYALNNFPEDVEERNKCVSFLYMTWKIITCIFSHVTLISLVVSYCILGAFTFEHLESQNEKQVLNVSRKSCLWCTKFIIQGSIGH